MRKDLALGRSNGSWKLLKSVYNESMKLVEWSDFRWTSELEFKYFDDFFRENPEQSHIKKWWNGYFRISFVEWIPNVAKLVILQTNDE